MKTSGDLLPRHDTREAALFFVVCALCFLASFAGLFARAAYVAADQWTDQVTGQITIRVRGDEAAAARAREIANASPGVDTARAISREEAEALLEPWLGSSGLPKDLPLPFLIAASTTRDAPAVADIIEQRLKDEGIEASVDEHSTWSEDLRNGTNAVGLAALSAVSLLIATAVAVIAFATHAALLARRDIVEVLHLTGARTGFIASLFEQRFLMLGVRAGATGALLALVGAGSMILLFRRTQGQMWFLPQLSLSLTDGLILGLTPLLAGLAAMLAARITVMQSLKEMI
jgi:cell division transport system permease protein